MLFTGKSLWSLRIIHLCDRLLQRWRWTLSFNLTNLCTLVERSMWSASWNQQLAAWPKGSDPLLIPAFGRLSLYCWNGGLSKIESVYGIQDYTPIGQKMLDPAIRSTQYFQNASSWTKSRKRNKVRILARFWRSSLTIQSCAQNFLSKMSRPLINAVPSWLYLHFTKGTTTEAVSDTQIKL